MSDDVAGLLWIVLLAAGIWFFNWVANSALRYSIQYNATDGMVTVEKKPGDCDFLHAPMGRKDCDYEKEVVVVMHGRDAGSGRATISYDAGKTWIWDDGGPGKGTSVYVTWRKVTP